MPHPRVDVARTRGRAFGLEHGWFEHAEGPLRPKIEVTAMLRRQGDAGYPPPYDEPCRVRARRAPVTRPAGLGSGALSS
jgi:hypothetical protein